MPEARRILFVCTGNICRSAMAEQLLRHEARVKGLPYEARSCGVGAESWFEVPAAVRKLLAARGIPEFEHSPRLITREQLEWADLVLGMTKAHVDDMKGIFPEFKAKLALLRERAGLGKQDVEDPMNRPDEDFVRCLDRIQESLDALIKNGFK